MNWFCKSYSVCKECHVHFEPSKNADPRFADLCEAHRKPAEEACRRKERVANWAINNIDKVEPMMLADEQQRNASSQAFMTGLYAQQQAAMAASGFRLYGHD